MPTVAGGRQGKFTVHGRRRANTEEAARLLYLLATLLLLCDLRPSPGRVARRGSSSARTALTKAHKSPMGVVVVIWVRPGVQRRILRTTGLFTSRSDAHPLRSLRRTTLALEPFSPLSVSLRVFGLTLGPPHPPLRTPANTPQANPKPIPTSFYCSRPSLQGRSRTPRARRDSGMYVGHKGLRGLDSRGWRLGSPACRKAYGRRRLPPELSERRRHEGKRREAGWRE